MAQPVLTVPWKHGLKCRTFYPATIGTTGLSELSDCYPYPNYVLLYRSCVRDSTRACHRGSSYRNYRKVAIGLYRISHYRTIGAIGQLSDFTVLSGLSRMPYRYPIRSKTSVRRQGSERTCKACGFLGLDPVKTWIVTLFAYCYSDVGDTEYLQ